MADQPFYSVKQVAELLVIRDHGVLSLIRSGEIRALDVSLQPGGRPRWRILPDDFDSFVSRRTHQASPPRGSRRTDPSAPTSASRSQGGVWSNNSGRGVCLVFIWHPLSEIQSRLGGRGGRIAYFPHISM